MEDPQTRKATNVVANLGPHPCQGDPNGQVEAITGALACDLTGGAGSTLWVKESSPTPSTGWVGK